VVSAILIQDVILVSVEKPKHVWRVFCARGTPSQRPQRGFPTGGLLRCRGRGFSYAGRHGPASRSVHALLGQSSGAARAVRRRKDFGIREGEQWGGCRDGPPEPQGRALMWSGAVPLQVLPEALRPFLGLLTGEAKAAPSGMAVGPVGRVPTGPKRARSRGPLSARTKGLFGPGLQARALGSLPPR
jgi:hypothetical protein